MRQLALDYTGAVLTADTDDLAILKNRGPRFPQGLAQGQAPGC